MSAVPRVPTENWRDHFFPPRRVVFGGYHLGMNRKRDMFGLVHIAVLATVLCLSGCASVEEDLCDARCECEGYCSDYWYDECVRDYDGKLREAEYRGCEDYYEDLVACQDETGFC